MPVSSKLMLAAAETGRQRYIGIDGSSVLFKQVTSSCVVSVSVEAREAESVLIVTASAGMCVPPAARTKVAKRIGSAVNGGWGTFTIDPESGQLVYEVYCGVVADGITKALLETLITSAVSAWQASFRTFVRLAFTKTSANSIVQPTAESPKTNTIVRAPATAVMEQPARRKRGRPRKDELPPAAYA
jgi:hypothetical protein